MPNASFDLFISYRRSDSAGHARALYRDLCRRFDKQVIFFDRESIEAGTVFPDRLREALESCRVALTLIAPGWLETKAAGGGRRIDDEEDVVRREIGLALQLKRKVIPVLFDDTPMPDAKQLPEPLRGLADCDALTLRGKNFEYDIQLEELVRLVAAVPGMPAPRPPSEGVIVGGGLEFDVYRGARYIPIRLRSPLRAAFQPIIDDRTKVFTGRRTVFERIMQFAGRDEGGYLVVTAPPGFGKTALIANLVSATPEAFAYHFFAPLYGEETLDEKFFLENLLQQMAAWHGYSAELPDAINDLRALFQQFVSTPLDHRQVLVLDGLDEVLRWKLNPYLGRRLPAHLHVVATVRDVGQDWRSDYGFPPDQVTSLPLGGLDRTEIRDLFAGLGSAGLRIAHDDALVEHIVQRAVYEDDPRLGADPFYVRFLAEDVANADVAPEEIPDQPKGLASYLDRWWKQIVQLAGDLPVRDLFGTLAAAAGPLARTDLEAINASLRDDWAGDFFDQVLSRVRRVVRQDRDGRYSIAHPRLRRYVADPRRIGKIDEYRKRLVEYCAQWKVNRSPYALAFQVAHLAEGGRIEDLYRLFSGEWMAAHWSVLGSYGPLVADLNRAAAALLDADTPDYTRVLALVVARETGRELMLGFPEELFAAWTRQGEVERTMACLGALGRTKGRAIDPLIAVAGTLLELHREGTGDYATLAGELLTQAAEQLPMVRATINQFDALTTLAGLLPAQSGLAEGVRQRLIRQLIEFPAKSSDEVLMAAGKGAIASALCSSAPDLDLAQDLLAQARASLTGINSPADQAFVLACLLPAMEATVSGEVLPELERLVELGPALLEHSSLKKNPCIRLMERWRPWTGARTDQAAALLLRFARLYLGDPVADYAGNALGAIVPHLCKLGQVSTALELIDQCWRAAPLEAARAVVYSIDALLEFAPGRVADWLPFAKGLTDPSAHDMPINRDLFTGSVATALAATGDWEGAIKLSVTLPEGERAKTLVNLLRRAATAFGQDADARGKVVERIMKVAGELHDEDEAAERARIGAVAAQVLGLAAGDRARAELARATALCLGHLPEGDNDNLRRLHAVALEEDGATAEALEAVGQMTWVTSVAATLISLLESGITDTAHREAYAQALLDELTRREGASLYRDALVKLASTAVRLSQESAPMGRSLIAYIGSRIDMLGIVDRLRVFATIAAGACHIDAVQGAQLFKHLLDWIESLRANNEDIEASSIAELIVQLAGAAGTLGDQLPDLVQRARSLGDGFGEGHDALIVRGALCLLDAQHDCQATRQALEGLLPEIDALADAQPAAWYLSRMVADLVGRHVGDNEPQAKAADSVAQAVVRCAHHCPAEASHVLEQVLDRAIGIHNEDDRAQALIDIFGRLKDGPTGWPPGLESVLSSVLERANVGDELENSLFEAAIAVICSAGDLEGAERLARAASAQLVEHLLASVNSERERLALGKLSGFEREFVSVGNSNLAEAVLHSVKVENDSANVIRQLADLLVSEQSGTERVRLLSDFLPSTAAPLRKLHGTGEIGRLISEVEAFDNAFWTAAHIIGQG